MTDSVLEQLCRLMNCQKLSLEACTHAAQNEHLLLRMVVQVLFFEQLRLRTKVAGWFFLSDNVYEGSPSAADGYLPRKSGELDFAPGSEDDDADKARDNEHASVMSVEEIRQRVVELEECSSMCQEIHLLGKTKGALSRLFRKLGLGGRSSSRQQQPSSSNEKRRSLDFEC